MCPPKRTLMRHEPGAGLLKLVEYLLRAFRTTFLPATFLNDPPDLRWRVTLTR